MIVSDRGRTKRRRATHRLRIVLLVCAAAPAVAQTPPSAADRAAAETLFRDGKKLATEGQAAAACEKFAESQRLDPGVGTLLELAGCDERAGRMASAWVEYTEAAAASERVGRKDRVAFSRAGVARVEPQMAYLTIDLPAETRALPGVQVQRDGAPVGAGALGVAIPVDPGDHVLTASAPGHSTWTRTVTVPSGPKREIVEVPALAPDPVPAPLPAPRAPAPPATAWSTWRTVGIASAGAGVVSAVVGGAFGLKASSDWSDFKSKCAPSACADASARPLYDDASTAATLSTVFIAAGAAAVALGAYLFFFPPGPRAAAAADAKPAVAWAPYAGPGGAGISVWGGL